MLVLNWFYILYTKAKKELRHLDESWGGGGGGGGNIIIPTRCIIEVRYPAHLSKPNCSVK